MVFCEKTTRQSSPKRKPLHRIQAAEQIELGNTKQQRPSQAFPVYSVQNAFAKRVDEEPEWRPTCCH